ncbi:TetR/AcrR family transcriptional regulator [Seohaeicola nanhaiensis]|uniref:TetR/AcrR family transcriptional regulator n=1 Tax=Seohaeicola nanhaiensis TaxID=1387282 RepID=A0ABV9KGX8_9RHOB
MTDRPLSTKERLIRSASELFRQRGYSGVGVAEILDAAKAPKGSLYHHFPNGKADLAQAAATWSSDGMLKLIAASFEPASGFSEGCRTLCYKLAKLFDISGSWETCPIASALTDGPDNTAFRDLSRHLFDGWIAEFEHHALRFGASPEEARRKAEHFFILLQGGWDLARSRRDSDVMRKLPLPE